MTDENDSSSPGGFPQAWSLPSWSHIWGIDLVSHRDVEMSEECSKVVVLLCLVAGRQVAGIPMQVKEFSGGQEVSEKQKQEELLASDVYFTPRRWFPEERMSFWDLLKSSKQFLSLGACYFNGCPTQSLQRYLCLVLLKKLCVFGMHLLVSFCQSQYSLLWQ